MVYQHFTLVPSMTVAENLVMSRDDVPAVVNWRKERERLDAFMVGVPFRVSLDTPVSRLAAGEKQKVEILKQLYLHRRFMILDEPTSVLTPQEADEVLGLLKQLTARQRDHGAHDHAQVPRSDGVCRSRHGAQARQIRGLGRSGGADARGDGGDDDRHARNRDRCIRARQRLPAKAACAWPSKRST